MFSLHMGGIEQAFLDYSRMLNTVGVKTINVTRNGAEVNNVVSDSVKYSAYSSYDFITRFRLKRLIKRESPDVIICHGNRALDLFSSSIVKSVHAPKIIAVAHNYSIDRIKKADAAIAITNHLQEQIKKLPSHPAFIKVIPNCIDVAKFFHKRLSNNNSNEQQEQRSRALVIGTMGRFVAKKGFDSFLNTLAKLKNQDGIAQFKAILAGDGEEKANLMKLAKKLNLSDVLEIRDWVTDKNKFFSDIDIFCLPSLHEPFGIVLLEAMASGVPVVSSAAEGPLEIIENERNGILFTVGDSDKMALALVNVMSNESMRGYLAQNALEKVRHEYDIKVVAKSLYEFLRDVSGKT